MRRVVSLSVGGMPEASRDGQAMTTGQYTAGGISASSGTLPTPRNVTTYRRIANNPIICIARQATMIPIRSADWSIATEGPEYEDAAETVTKVCEALMFNFIAQALRCLDYGYQSFEVIWGERDGSLVPVRFKPLLPELTTARIDATGQFAGVKNKDVILEAPYVFWLSNDQEGDNYYGKSRSESAIASGVWSGWETTLARMIRYAKNASGPRTVAEYPQGEGYDSSGAKKDNFDIASAVLRELMSDTSDGVIIPRALDKSMLDALAGLSRTGVDLSQLMAWKFTFIEPRGQYGNDYTAMMRLLDSYLLRSWLVPERAVTEGQYGTKAEAEVHAGLTLANAEAWLWEFSQEFNKQVIDRVLLVNYGEDYVGKVRWEPGQIVDEKRAFMAEILRGVFANPMSVDMLASLVDIRGELERQGVSVRAADASDPDLDAAGMVNGLTDAEPNATPNSSGT